MIRQRAFAVACAATATTVLGLVAAPSQAITLGDLLKPTSDSLVFKSNGNTFTDHDLLFSNFSWQIATGCVPSVISCVVPPDAVGPLNPFDITVGPATTLHGFGLLFNDNFKAEEGYFIDFALDYDVSVKDDGPDITDIHLSFVGAPSPGNVIIDEQATESGTGTFLAALSATNDLKSEHPFQDGADFTKGVKKAHVSKDILLEGKGGTARFSRMDQEFSRPVKTPESSTVGGLLVFGSLGIGAMLKRRQQSNKLALSATPNDSGN